MKDSMKTNFENLQSRVKNCLYSSDLEKINYELSKIESPILISGVGGSSVVSTFASRVLNEKNKIITKCVEPRDLLYMNKNGFKSVLACSYSGNNYGVMVSFLNNLKHYLLSSKEHIENDIIDLTYKCDSLEHSFISLSSTLIPCSVLLSYYLDNLDFIDYIKEYSFDFEISCDAYEIFTGIETSTSAKYLESTLVEAGLGLPIVHDKYSFCHGRSTLSTVYNNVCIYFNTNTELDNILISELRRYYKDIVILDTASSILDEYILLIKCMYLTKYVAEKKNKDLSKVVYNPVVKKIYNFKGEM